jgi:hypothetical protein
MWFQNELSLLAEVSLWFSLRSIALALHHLPSWTRAKWLLLFHALWLFLIEQSWFDCYLWFVLDKWWLNCRWRGKEVLECRLQWHLKIKPMCSYHYWDVTQQVAIVYFMWTFVMSNPKLCLNPLLPVVGSGEDCWRWWIVYLTTGWIRKSYSSVIALSYDNLATLMMLHGCENWHNIMVGCFMMCEREALHNDLSGHYCLQCDMAAEGWIQWRDCMLPLSKLSRLEYIVWGKPMYYNNKLWGWKLAMSDQKPRHCWSC